MNKQLPDSSVLETKEGPCAICLEETITNPVGLPCGHVFCFVCVGQYQRANVESDEAASSCPYCRGNIPIVFDEASDRMKLYLSKACLSSDGSEDQKKYAKLAMTEYDSVAELLSPDQHDEDTHLTLLYSRALIMDMTDQPVETIKVTKELLSLNERYPNVLDVDQVDEIKQWQVEAYSACGKWKEAVDIYQLMFREYCLHRRELPPCRIVKGLIRALYETGEYDKAIKYGNQTINAPWDHRTIPGVHKYVALSQKAKGDIDGAKKTISKAIFHEEHWDKDNLQKNKEILKEISNL